MTHQYCKHLFLHVGLKCGIYVNLLFLASPTQPSPPPKKNIKDLGPVVQSLISTNPGLTLNKTYRVNPGLALIGL